MVFLFWFFFFKEIGYILGVVFCLFGIYVELLCIVFKVFFLMCLCGLELELLCLCVCVRERERGVGDVGCEVIFFLFCV